MHRDALIVHEIGQATVDAALEQQQLEARLFERWTDEELEADQESLTVPREHAQTANALERYDMAHDLAAGRIKGLFDVIASYRFGSVNPGELTLDQENAEHRSIMTTLNITSRQNDIRVDKRLTAITLDPSTGMTDIVRSSLLTSYGEALIVDRVISRMQEVNRLLRES